MKQYTNSEQTAKLIELGLPKPKNRLVKQRFDRSTSSWIVVGEEGDYSIGELIEMLPEATCRSNADDDHYHLTIYNDAMYWNIAYRNDYDDLCYVAADDLIDALYDMIIKLKEEGVIWGR